MSQLVQFSPTTDAPFSFLATLDGGQYNVVITWNLFGRRFYINVYSATGADPLVMCRALVGSVQGSVGQINLVAGYFNTSAIYFYPATQQFLVTP